MAHIPIQKTQELVRNWTLQKITQEEIAKRLGITVKTLVRHYGYELYFYRYDLISEAQNKIIEAMGCGQRWAVEMILKCLAGWVPPKPPDESDSAESLLEKLLKDKIAAHGS